jgi:hypothetical protein
MLSIRISYQNFAKTKKKNEKKTTTTARKKILNKNNLKTGIRICRKNRKNYNLLS